MISYHIILCTVRPGKGFEQGELIEQFSLGFERLYETVQ
jgi:hypothetical protein